VEAIMAEARAELWRTNQAILTARETSMDPLAAPQAVTKARKDLEDLEHAQGRLTVALDRLADVLADAQDREAEAQRLAVYEAARRARDEVAEELRARYPTLAGELVTLLREVGAAEAQVRAANADRPAGAPYLEGVETVARGIPGNGYVGGTPVGTLAATLRLPALAGADAVHQRPVWPPAYSDGAYEAGAPALDRYAAAKRAEREEVQREAGAPAPARPTPVQRADRTERKRAPGGAGWV
jgi:hypothetical protein